MVGDYFSHLNFAFSYLQFKDTEPNARLTYFAILYKWNAFKRCRSFYLTDRELQSLTGLGSNAITRAKRKLKNLGLIDFRTSRSGTTYFFTETANTHQKPSGNTHSDAKTNAVAVISTTNNVINKKEEKSGGAREELWEM